jgi:hypothetical protein
MNNQKSLFSFVKCGCRKGEDILCKHDRRRQYHSNHYHQGVRFLVLLRDDFSCVACKKKLDQTILNVHHIKGRNHSGLDLECSLCVQCHAVVERSRVFVCKNRPGEEILLWLWKEKSPQNRCYQPSLFNLN